MTRFEFMYRLEQELQDISIDEREEALKYYEEYIADAGTLSDDQLVKEFGTPERVAAMIKADLSSKEKEAAKPEEDSKIYTERGFEDTQYSDFKFEMTEDSKKTDNTSENHTYQSYQTNNTNENEQNFGSDFNQGQTQSSDSYYNYGSRTEQSNRSESKKHSGIWKNKLLWIILAIFFLPVIAKIIFGLFTGIFGVAAAIFFTAVSLILILMFCSGGFILSGIIVTIFGIVRMFQYPVMEGLFCSGMGIVLFGIGMLLLPMTSWIFTVAIPTVLHIVKNFFERVSKRRRGTL